MSGKVKLLLVLLAISLAGNVFFFGKTLGSKYHKFRNKPSMDFNLRGVGAHLTKEQKKQARDILHSRRSELISTFKNMKETEEQIKALIAAETVDTEALAELLENRATAMKTAHDPLKQLMLEFIPTLDFETRKKIAEVMFKHGDGKRFKKRRRFHQSGEGHERRRRDGDSGELPTVSCKEQ